MVSRNNMDIATVQILVLIFTDSEESQNQQESNVNTNSNETQTEDESATDTEQVYTTTKSPFDLLTPLDILTADKKRDQKWQKNFGIFMEVFLNNLFIFNKNIFFIYNDNNYIIYYNFYIYFKNITNSKCFSKYLPEPFQINVNLYMGTFKKTCVDRCRNDRQIWGGNNCTISECVKICSSCTNENKCKWLKVRDFLKEARESNDNFLLQIGGIESDKKMH